MIGQKLHELINELTLQEHKAVIQHCNSVSDKRFKILRRLINLKQPTLEERNVFLHNEVLFFWSSVTIKELDLKKRRLVSFFSDEIENVILALYLEKNKSTRQLLLAEAKISNGNLELLNHYYHKAYQKAGEEENTISKLISLKGKIRMGYAAQSEKELSKVKGLNEEFFEVLNVINEKSISEYYENLSNIFLEKNSLFDSNKLQVENEILGYLSKVKSPLIKASLHVSLAKFNYYTDAFDVNFEMAKKILRAISKKTNEYNDLERKMIFLELRLKFFSGARPETLISISNDIINGQNMYSVINNNAMFYKILSIILKDNLVLAKTMMEENSVYFKENGQLLKDFLNGIIAEKEDDVKKALYLLQPLMYTSNHFFSVFSRLTVIKIKMSLPYDSNLDSLIDSTSRHLRVNENNPLGKEANEFVLKFFKSKNFRHQLNQNLDVYIPVLSSFHQYLLSDFKILVGQK
jgi:hypothetical protein